MAITNIYKGNVERIDIQKIYKGTTLLYEVVNEYYNYAKAYYTATNNLTLFENAWESSLAVDPLEISEDSSSASPRGTAQYPNGEIEGVIIPNGVTSIGNNAFRNWTSNNQPLVIPNSVTSIGSYAFGSWKANNQPLVIPNSVTNIKAGAFLLWSSNNHPLVIPDSVTSIESFAFQNWPLVPYVEIRATTPPTLAGAGAFSLQNDAPIYVPDESVNAYKTATNWVNLADRIFPISDRDEYFYYAKDYYTATGNSALFENAWQDMEDSKTVLFDIPLALAAPNQEMGGMTIDLYVGTDGQLQALYDACANETIPPPINSQTRDVYYVNNVATYYMGDVSGEVGFLIPLYMFGNFNANENISFIIVDLTPLEMGLGLVLAKPVNVSIPNNNIVIQQGFEFENENGIIIPNSVISIGYNAFYGWTSNNRPLVIPNSVTNIGEYAFDNWTSNNQPLVIPNSVTSIESSAFVNWKSNNQPLVIPNSVTSIGEGAFFNWSSVPYVEIRAITPPTIAHSNAFGAQVFAPIYVPDESVDDYKTATQWVNLADRIFSINDK
jgi:hypothetical protein